MSLEIVKGEQEFLRDESPPVVPPESPPVLRNILLPPGAPVPLKPRGTLPTTDEIMQAERFVIGAMIICNATGAPGVEPEHALTATQSAVLASVIAAHGL